MAQPNILFILSDQHAQRALGCYGDTADVTPRLDALAAQGVTFDNAYCASPICGPSRMALMTGRMPFQNRCWLNQDILPTGVPTFAHALGAAGYHTALIGRMHFIGPDQTHGFAERLVGDHSANWPGNSSFDHGELRGTAGPDPVSVIKSGAGTNAYDLKDRDTSNAAVDWLAAAGKRHADGDAAPFLLTVGFMLPHPPYVADPEDFAAVAGKVPPIRQGPPDPASEHPWLRGWRAPRDLSGLSEASIERARQAYWAMVRRLDGLVGAVLDALDAAGLAEDTLVIYGSDHGDHLGERGIFWKHTLFDESAKVPLIMRWPGRLPSAEWRRAVVGLADLGATMLDVAGGEWPGGGTSLLPLAYDASAPWLDETFSEYCQGVGDPWSAPEVTLNRMIRRGQFKLCYYHGAPPQLFDLDADPGEQHDLADNPRYVGLRDGLVARVTADWHPDEIAREIVQNERDNKLLSRWAARTHPPESYRWQMPPGKHPSLT